MVSAWPHIARCIDLREDDIANAIGRRQSTQDLLSHLAAVCAPDTGAAKILLVLARMATTACDWLDGGLRVDLHPDGDRTRVDITTDLGGGLLERALPSLVLAAPLTEFLRAIERVPRLVAPLAVERRGPKRLVLAATVQVRRTSIPPPPIEIAPESLVVLAPVPPPPTVAHGDVHADANPEADLDLLLPVVTRAAAPVVAPDAAPAPTTPPSALDALDRGWDD